WVSTHYCFENSRLIFVPVEFVAENEFVIKWRHSLTESENNRRQWVANCVCEVSDFQHHRNNHGATSRFTLDVALEFEPDLLFDDRPINALFVTGTRDSFANDDASFGQKLHTFVAEC